MGMQIGRGAVSNGDGKVYIGLKGIIIQKYQLCVCNYTIDFFLNLHI